MSFRGKNYLTNTLKNLLYSYFDNFLFFLSKKKIGLVFHYYHYLVWLSEDQENQSKFKRKKTFCFVFF